MSQFYETTILVTVPTVLPTPPSGVQVLVSPPRVDSTDIDYGPLLAELKEQSPLKSENSGEVSPSALNQMLAAIADPEWNRQWDRLGQFSDGDFFFFFDRGSEVGTFLLHEPLIAAETSPLTKRSIEHLARGATVTLLVLAGVPTIVIVSGSVGFAVIRGLGAVTGPIWDGVRPELTTFGGDAAATLLDALRRKLGIKRRN